VPALQWLMTRIRKYDWIDLRSSCHKSEFPRAVAAAPRRADVALVLADKWQGRALGRRLLATLLEHAQTAGVRDAVGVVLATNKAMLRLARSMGFAMSAEPGDAMVVRIRRDLRIRNAQPH